MMNNKIRIFSTAAGLVLVAVALSSCWHSKESRGYEYAPNMYYAIAPNPDQKNSMFKDGKAAQNPVHGTIPVGWKTFDYPNTLEGYEAAGREVKNPLTITDSLLKDSKTLYENMCSHCHGQEGKGDGSIVKLDKFPPPPSYSTGNSSRGGFMKDLTDGKIYHTITYGVNNMGSHASQLSPQERWMIVAYVHELQKLQ